MQKNNKKLVFIPLILGLFLIFLPHFVWFVQKDICLDEGGSWNKEEHICEKTSKVKDVSENKTLTYSNLVDSATQEEVEEALLKAGIKEENVKNFFQNVSDYNSAIGNNSLVLEGFSTISNLNPTYDDEKNIPKLEEKYPDFMGNNCRITSFSLFKDLVSVGNPVVGDTDILAFDFSSLAETPNKFLTEDERKIFESFFSSINTPKTRDLETHINSVKESFKNKEIKFLTKGDETKASLISVFFHSIEEEKSYLFIGHVGILLSSSDGKIIFIEKLSFQEPYQAIKFKNREELVNYLMNKYDVDYGQETARPFIFENDELIEISN